MGILILLPSVQSLPLASAEESCWDNHGAGPVSAAPFCRAERQEFAVFCTSSSAHPEPLRPCASPTATPRCPLNTKPFTAHPLLVPVAEPRAGLGTLFFHHLTPDISMFLPKSRGCTSRCCAHLLTPLSVPAALHRQRPWDPPVFPASGIRSYHPCGSRAAAAAIYR